MTQDELVIDRQINHVNNRLFLAMLNVTFFDVLRISLVLSMTYQ